MASNVGALASARRGDVATGAVHARALTAGEAAWLAVLPCALLVVLSILLLGPPLGAVLLPPPSIRWLELDFVVREPTEQARYLVALSGPVLLAAATWLLARRAPSVHPIQVRRLVLSVQWIGVAFVATCFAVQRATVFALPYYWPEDARDTVYFTGPTLAVAALLTGGILVGLADDGLRARLASALSETRSRRLLATGGAVVLLVVFFLPSIHFEDTTRGINGALLAHLPFSMDETWAVLDGRSPLVDFVAQYGALWPYPVALVMSVVGPSIGAFTVALAAISVLALLGVFDVLRRTARSSVGALLLFAPFLATSAFMMEGPLEERYAVSTLPSMFPLRYAGPLILLWLAARHLDGARPRSLWALFAVGGLVTLNNAEFGIAATGATVAALLCTGAGPLRQRIGRIVLGLAVGYVAAYALVAALTLARTGELPDVFALLSFSRLLATGGFAMLPMQPLIGFSTVIYLTYVAAIGTATVRVLRGDPDRLLTGLLAWAGVFGLGIGSYYMGRSHPQVLTNMFAAWGLCVVLLTLVAVRAQAVAGRRLPSPAIVACLFAFGLMVCSLGQVPRPWSDVSRLARADGAAYQPPDGQRFVAANTRPGEPVAIVLHLGHRIAYNLGLDNVSPYAGAQSIFTVEQVDETVDALRAAGGTKLFALDEDVSDAFVSQLLTAGFVAAPLQRGLMRFDAPWAPRAPPG